MFGTSTPIALTDVEIVQPPPDGISSISFSPSSPNFLCATSWDNGVRVWEIDVKSRNSQPKLHSAHEQPVLCHSWSADGKRIFSGSTDGKAKCWDLQTNQSNQVAQHAAPIKGCIWIEELQVLATASWDKTLKYWDCRQPNAVATINLPERCYSMDVKHPLVYVATAEKHVCVYHLSNPQADFKRLTSSLKHQTRVIAGIPNPNQQGYAVGSIEGRVAFQHINDEHQVDNFAFKCHRENTTDLYAVNSIVFHPLYGTFATAGSDGTYNYWDKDSKQRLKAFPKTPAPIPCAAFNNTGNSYAYASSYDWSKGADHYNPTTAKNTIYLHAVIDTEIKPRPSTTSSAGSRRR